MSTSDVNRLRKHLDAKRRKLDKMVVGEDYQISGLIRGGDCCLGLVPRHKVGQQKKRELKEWTGNNPGSAMYGVSEELHRSIFQKVNGCHVMVTERALDRVKKVKRTR